MGEDGGFLLYKFPPFLSKMNGRRKLYMQQNKRLITISMLSAVAFVLTFIKFPLPFIPPYLTLDFSDVPTLLATFLLSPIAGIIVALIKNILNFLFNIGDPVGPVANFLAGVSFLLSSYYVYRKRRNNRSLIKLKGMTPDTITIFTLLSTSPKLNIIPYNGSNTK